MDGLNALMQSPLALSIVVGLFSLLIGSFLNVVIYRLPVMMKSQWRQECIEFLEQATEPVEEFNLLFPRSRCQHCQAMIHAIYNIPVFSFIYLRGRCAMCEKPISMRYPIIEVLTAILSAYVAWHFGFGLQLVAALLLTWALIAATFIDLDEQLIPDTISLPLLWIGILLNVQGLFTTLESSVIGAAAGYMSLWTFTSIYYLLTGKFGMGHGDFKLFAVFGAWLGWQMLPFIIICSTLVGAVIGMIILTVKSAESDTPIPFGPYLAIAGWIALLWGGQINQWYINTMM